MGSKFRSLKPKATSENRKNAKGKYNYEDIIAEMKKTVSKEMARQVFLLCCVYGNGNKPLQCFLHLIFNFWNSELHSNKPQKDIYCQQRLKHYFDLKNFNNLTTTRKNRKLFYFSYASQKLYGQGSKQKKAVPKIILGTLEKYPFFYMERMKFGPQR